LSNEHVKSGPPAFNDGRNINPAISYLTGEAASQIIDVERQPPPEATASWDKLPEQSRKDPSYYGVPMLKKPVWEWAIPLYYYVGGAAGASIAFAAATQLFGTYSSQRAAQRFRLLGIGGASLGGALLIYDLGRSSRFLNMLRVFRPTSPMNMGAWILAGTVPSAIAAELVCSRRGVLGLLSRSVGLISGIFGMGLATYTGVLISNSAIPVWSESRTILPILFGASAIASAAAAFDLLEAGHSYRSIGAFGLVGRMSELASAQILERKLLNVPRVAIPLHKGRSGFLWKAATVLTAGSLVVSLLPIQKRKKRIVAGVLASLGSVCLRFGIHEAGVPSAEDSRASFRLQHRQLEQRVSQHEAQRSLQ
jgi:formate-dependent nitrite reductase membrane component NrfD